MHVLITFRQRVLIQLITDDGLTIQELQNHIANATGIPPRSQTLTCNGVLLDSNCHLKDYKLPSTVRICLDVPLNYPHKYRIYVKTPLRNRLMEVSTRLEGTLGDLKKMISYQENVPLDQEILVHNSRILAEENDSQTLIALGIRENEEVEVILKCNIFDLPEVTNGRKMLRESPAYRPASESSKIGPDSEVEVGHYRRKEFF